MTRRLRQSLLVALSTLAALVLLGWHAWREESGAVQVLAQDGKYRWYRGNLHTHTLWSDGNDYPEMVALWYKDHGYDFLCFTDHNTLLDKERWIDVLKSRGELDAYEKLKARFTEGWIEEKISEEGRLQVRLKKHDEIAAKLSEPGNFLLIQGQEISDKLDKYPVHLNATNLRERIEPRHGDNVYEVMQRNVDAVLEQRRRSLRPMLVHLNHPNFGWGITAEDLMRVRGENFFEVYNGHPTVYNAGDSYHASTDRIWDIILTRRLTELDLPLMFGLATDDGHDYHHIPDRTSNPGRGWIYVLSRDLTPAALIDSMEKGWFYASSGVQLDRVITGRKGLYIQIHTEPDVTYTTEFIGTRKGFDRSSEPVLDKDGNEMRVTRHYSDEIGMVLKTTTGEHPAYEFQPDDIYIRARITSSRKHPNPSVPGEFERAWTQPVRGPAGWALLLPPPSPPPAKK